MSVCVCVCVCVNVYKKIKITKYTLCVCVDVYKNIQQNMRYYVLRVYACVLMCIKIY